MKLQTPILMYHAVSDHAPSGFERFAVTPKRFQAQMQLLRDIGYDAISVRDYSRRIQDETLDASTVVLTFDDGFRDFEEAVLPQLSKYGFSATLYVVSGLVGKTSSWLPAKCSQIPLLNWRQISDVEKLGVEIGAHTMTHPKLDGLPLAEARGEILGSRLRIEDRLGVEVASFAYPFGFRNPRIIRLVAEAGFKSACAVRYKTATSDDNAFDLPRHIVRGNMKLEEFERVVRGKPPRLRQALDSTRSELGAIWRNTFARVQI